MLCEMLSLTWSYNSCAKCCSAWAVMNDWETGQIVRGEGRVK